VGEEDGSTSGTPGNLYNKQSANWQFCTCHFSNTVQYFRALDGRNNFCGIKFRLSKNAKVTIQIYNSTNNWLGLY
jgi:hypothetical protein